MSTLRPLLLALLLAFPFAFQTAGHAAPAAKAAPVADAILAAMSLEDKIGQMFCVYFPGSGLSGELAAMIRDARIGGVIYYSAAGNIVDNRQTADLSAAIQAEAAKTPSGVGLFIGVDQEGGPVARFTRHFTVMPSNMAVAATGDPKYAALAASVTARELAALGVNLNFAPVADVNSNPQNPIIGIRSFGDDPRAVGRFTAAAVRAYKQNGMLCTPKHFPGHGDAGVDSHLGLPLVDRGADALWAVDFPPFAAAFAAGADAVMTAHVELPAIDPASGTPATLSAPVLQGLLRRDMGFDGLIFTDSMGMGALTRHFGVEEAAVRAVQAGADILLYGADRDAKPDDQRRAISAVLAAVREGTIPAGRIEDSARRILRVKEAYGLLRAMDIPAPPKNPDAFTATPAHERAALTIALKSVTLVKNEGGLLPLSPKKPTLVVRPRRDRPQADAAAEAAIAGWPNIQLTVVSQDPSPAEIALAIARFPQAENIVILTYDALRRPGQAALVRAFLEKRPGRVVVAATGAPYDLTLFQNAPVLVCAYGDVPVSLRALGQTLFGRRSMTGSLPLALGALTNKNSKK